MARVSRHSHDGSGDSRYQQPMAERVFIREKAPRNRFIDDRDLRRLGPVLGGERPSGANLYTHRLKVFRADEIDIDDRPLSLLKQLTPFDLKLGDHQSSFQRNLTRQAGGLDARQSTDARKNLTVIRVALRRLVRISSQAWSERERQYAVRIEAFGNCQQTQETLDHQPAPTNKTSESASS